MVVALPEQLETALKAHAEKRQVSIEHLVCDAIEWYLRMDPDLLDELAAWQEVRDEALEIVENSVS